MVVVNSPGSSVVVKSDDPLDSEGSSNVAEKKEVQMKENT